MLKTLHKLFTKYRFVSVSVLIDGLTEQEFRVDGAEEKEEHGLTVEQLTEL